jgi:hypothetical protein
MELPSYASFSERHEAIHDQLLKVVASKPGDDLAWCAVPNISGMSRPHAGRRAFEQRPLPRAKRSQIMELDAALDPMESAGYRALGRCLSCAGSANQRRSQDPAFERLGWGRAALEPVRVGRLRLRRRLREASALGDEITELLAERDLEMPVKPRAIYRKLFQWARELAVAEALVARERPELVVVGATPSGSARPLLRFARKAGVPSVYVPHAPSSGLVHLEDLPVDYVALRGPREAEHFAGHGVDPAKLDVAGNPTLEPIEPVSVDAGRRPVLAVSPVRWEMSSAVELARGVLEAATLAPHPRADREAVSAVCPEGWDIWPGRTYELLQEGPPVLMQPSSGVALEAILLGIPTIELAYPGLPAPYPFIREPYIHFASSSEQLAAALAEAEQDVRQPERREAIVEWARGWSQPNGAEAATAIAAVIERARVEGPRGPAWDTWAG